MAPSVFRWKIDNYSLFLLLKCNRWIIRNKQDIKPYSFFRQLGPGFLIAATGVGAGDMIAAAVGGARYGTVILWVCMVGAVIKYVLNEGIARWQLATGKTVIRGWTEHFPRFINYYFFLFLLIWSFIVAGALMASCGLAAHAFFPALSVIEWGIIHSFLALLLVWRGKYGILELLMKFFVGLMFITILINLVLIKVDWMNMISGLFIPAIPEGSITFILGVIGGVGGSVTLLSYGYWIREKGWNGSAKITMVRWDLGVAYSLTGLFGVGVIALASGVHPDQAGGTKMVLALADSLELTVGVIGKWIFMLGFWGAVFSSMLGVWSGVPYIFTDFIASFYHRHSSAQLPEVAKPAYRLFLLFLSIPPICLLFLEKPVWIVLIYSITGALFIPFLGVLLLLMNNTLKWIGILKNDWLTNFILVVALALFGYLLIVQIT